MPCSSSIRSMVCSVLLDDCVAPTVAIGFRYADSVFMQAQVASRTPEQLPLLGKQK